MPAKPWLQKPRGRRESRSRNLRKVLILCEDKKSSCFYFEAFPIDRNRAQVIAVGTGKNTLSLVEDALKRKEKAEKAGKPYNAVWCVFDRDSFPLDHYQRAFDRARANSIHVAWANEAFELWYILHFKLRITELSRDDYKRELAPYLKYNKSDAKIYQKVKKHQATAFLHARQLEKHWNVQGEKFPERQNPSTNVHKLVEFLNELCELGEAS